MNSLSESTKVSQTRDVLLFRVSDVLCGINVMDIQEVRKDFEITPVPMAPEYVKGVMNLRGEIATVFLLSLRLGIESQPSAETDTSDKRVIVLKDRSGEFQGLLVDEIADTQRIDMEELSQSPGHLANIKEEYVEGLFRLDEDLVAILDLESVLKHT